MTVRGGPPPQALLVDYGDTLVSFGAPPAVRRRRSLTAAAGWLAAAGWPQAARPAFARDLDEALARHLGALQAAGRDDTFGRALATVLDGRQPRLGSGPPLTAAARRQVEVAMRRANLDLTVVAPGARTALGRLRAAGVRLALVSDTSFAAATLQWELAALGLGGLFTAVVTSGAVGWCKPDGRLFAAALRRLGVPAEGAWHVGDWWAGDVVGARALGIHALLWRRPEAPAAADVEVVDSFDRLAELVVTARR